MRHCHRSRSRSRRLSRATSSSLIRQQAGRSLRPATAAAAPRCHRCCCRQMQRASRPGRAARQAAQMPSAGLMGRLRSHRHGQAALLPTATELRCGQPAAFRHGSPVRAKERCVLHIDCKLAAPCNARGLKCAVNKHSDYTWHQPQGHLMAMCGRMRALHQRYRRGCSLRHRCSLRPCRRRSRSSRTCCWAWCTGALSARRGLRSMRTSATMHWLCSAAARSDIAPHVEAILLWPSEAVMQLCIAHHPAATSSTWHASGSSCPAGGCEGRSSGEHLQQGSRER